MESFEEDNTLTLSCSSVAIPPASLEWMHNGRPLSNSNNSITITMTRSLPRDTSMLQWMTVPRAADGMFICIATNNLGSESISIGVQILSKLLPS